MNTNNRSSYRGFGIYGMLILLVILIWFWLSGSSATSSYTKAQFVKDLKAGNVTAVSVVQNRETPTGSLRITLKNNTQTALYTSDVNEIQTLMEENALYRRLYEEFQAFHSGQA